MAAEWQTPTAVQDKCGEEGSHPAVDAIDDDTGTYWAHSSTEYHWIAFDLGETKAVSKIRLYQSFLGSYRWGEDLGLEVYVSDDPGDWGDAVWSGALNATGWQESGAFSKNGRYVKLVSLDTYFDQRMYEMDAETEAVGPPVGQPTMRRWGGIPGMRLTGRGAW